ncbi:MAG: shikimate dehydrogenase [Candidatus Brocadiia bacterium]|nr:shikimate dehydrogenase [Candidatus Brocadiia bacterium]
MTLLCVPLTEPTAEAALDFMHGLPECVGIVELRLDHVWAARPDAAAPTLRAICAAKDRPIIVTVRPPREGGLCEAPESERLDLLRLAAACGADYVDVELDSVGALGELAGPTRRIVSHHDFQRTPEDLDAIHARAARSGADVVKIAARALDITDAVPMLELLERRGAAVPTIALSMGEEGLATRILAPKFGAFLSFGAPREGETTGPGQVPFRRMEDMYRFSRIGPRTEVYGVVADPVAHSMSPAIHNAAFAELGVDAVYLPFKVSDPAAFLDGFQRYDLRGLSVTIPHKEAMAPLMDELDELSAQIGALNTVAIRSGRRYGSNTDVAAALEALECAVGEAGMLPLDRCTALVIGAGGAGRALAYALAGRVGKLLIANRTVQRAERLAGETGADWCGLDEVARHGPDVLINTTSVGMHPHVDACPVPPSILRAGMVVFDAVYNPMETVLLRDARRMGCVTASGFDWFVSQAAAQFETWTGRAAPRRRMAEVVRDRLSSE